MDITPEDFERFLTWLDPDQQQASKQYEAINAKMTRFFVCRGCGVDAEHLADETINRVIIKMRVLADSYVGDRLPYFFGVARYVHKEYCKRVKEEEEGIRRMRDLLPPPVYSSEEKEREDNCLERCMKELTRENRELIRKYYTGEKHAKIDHRRELADQMGIAPNALRIRAHRIRTDLRRCVEACVAEENDHETNQRNRH